MAMGKLIIVGVVAVVLFALSAGLSFFLKQAGHEGDGDGSAGPTAAERPPKGTLPKGVTPPSPTDLKSTVRAPFQPEGEAAVSMSLALSDRQERLKAQEQSLAVRKKLLETIQDDLRKEGVGIEVQKKDIKALLKEMEQQVAVMEARAAEIEEKRLQSAVQEKGLKKTMVEFAGVEQDRAKQMAAMFDNMDPEEGAKTLQQLADTGELDLAAKILSLMQERKAARILVAVPDRGVVVQLLDKLKVLKKSGTTLSK